MKLATEELNRFYLEYRQVQYKELAKLTNLEKKRFFTAGVMQVFETVAQIPTLDDLISVLETVTLAYSVPKKKWIFFDNPEYYLKYSLELALNEAKRIRPKPAGAPTSSGNVYQLPPKV